MRAKQLRYRTIAVVALVLPLLALGGVAEGKKPPPPVPWTGPVPKAHCGPNDRVESGLQGQTTLAERLSGDSERGYNCNLQLVGQFQGEGSWWQMAWFRQCAYYGTTGGPEQQHLGVVVVDAADPRNPQASTYLDNSRPMLNPHESLKVNTRRRLLGATGKGPDYLDPNARQFAFYDISDCAHPKLLSEVEVPETVGHAGDFTRDGRTYYGTGGGGWTAMDISDPTHPRKILRWVPPGGIGAPHDMSISNDGTRMYVAQPGNFVPFGLPGPDGLVIVDVSDIQFRRPNPQPRVISTLFWNDGGVAQQTIPVTIHGRPHLIFTDETGPGALPGPQASRVDACARGLTPFGFARIIDISDERNPKIISKLMLQVDDPANCDRVINDFPAATAEMESYGYSTHYCGVDKRENPKLLACGYLGGGLRVFDIRDPYHPKEIAYYKPPARRKAFLPGSAMWFDYSGPQALVPRLATGDRTTDRVQTQIRFRKYKGDLQIWFTSQDNGFQIVRFTNELLARTGLDKFEQDHPGNAH
ncbi:MAG TPA: hypothetical protein VFA46_22755 [Actinomycetes bacterium]|jgi:hypothetical protein|nr:hypothetical protein [Actinomycetes bacterium]